MLYLFLKIEAYPDIIVIVVLFRNCLYACLTGMLRKLSLMRTKDFLIVC